MNPEKSDLIVKKGELQSLGWSNPFYSKISPRIALNYELQRFKFMLCGLGGN